MWLSLALKEILSFLDKVSEKSYKGLILFLTALFLVTSVVTNNKVNAIKDTLGVMSRDIEKRDSAMEKRLENKLTSMSIEAGEIFNRYTLTNSEDLQTIIDNVSVSRENSSLLKKLVEKSSTDILQELKKAQFRGRYLPDSLNIRVQKIPLSDYLNINNPFYFNPNLLYVQRY